MWTRIIDAPLFSIFYFLFLVGSVLLGYYLAQRLYLQRNRTWEKSGVESSLIGFFALVISFTLSGAYNSSHARNKLIHQQGDALAQMHRESLLLPLSFQKNVRQYLLQHIDVQQVFFERRINKDSAVTLITRQNESFFTSMLNDSLYRQSLSSLMPSYNLLSSTTFHMLYSYDERTPLVIIFLLIISSWLAGLLVGFLNGFHRGRHILVPLLYIILAGFTMQAIRDLDNPLKGVVRPQYKNLQDIRRAIESKR